MRQIAGGTLQATLGAVVTAGTGNGTPCWGHGTAHPCPGGSKAPHASGGAEDTRGDRASMQTGGEVDKGLRDGGAGLAAASCGAQPGTSPGEPQRSP